MSFTNSRALTRLAGSAAVIVLAAGCGQPSRFQAPISRFRDACAVVIQSSKVYLVTLNKNERDTYIYQQLEFRRQITRSELDKAEVFSDASIAARTSALDQISNYTGLLYNLANSNAPASVKTDTDNLQQALTRLSGEVNSLTGASDARFKSVVNATFPIIGGLLQDLVNKKIEEALTQAIEKGTKPVNDLIEAIRLDMEVEYERKRSAVSGKLTAAILDYNREFEKGTSADPDKLRAYAGQISTAADQVETLRTAQPGEGLEAMKKANDALAAFVKQRNPSIRDFASFVDAVEEFANTAKRVGDAVQSLKQL